MRRTFLLIFVITFMFSSGLPDFLKQNVKPIITGQTSVTLNEDEEADLLLSYLTVTDPDNTYPNDFTLKILSGNNYTAQGIRLRPFKDFNGTLTVQVRVNDGTDDSETFSLVVTILDVDDAPVVKKPISDLNVTEDDSDKLILLNNNFSDIDSEITYRLNNNSNQDLIFIPEIKGDTLILQFKRDQFGQANISIIAESKGKQVEDVFLVVVNSVDDPPFVINPIKDVNVLEDANSFNINLAGVFFDVDNDIDQMTYRVSRNTNDNLVEYNQSQTNLTLSFKANQFGTSEITVEGRLNGAIVTDVFIVTVTEQDDPPEFIKPFIPLIFKEDQKNIIIRISDYIVDVDSKITYDIKKTTKNGVLTYTVDDSLLFITLEPDRSGTEKFFVKGTSNNLTTSDTLHLIIEPVDDPPRLKNKIADIILNEDAKRYKVNLDSVFEDIDTEITNFVFSVKQNSNESLLNAFVENNDSLVIELKPDQNGKATFYLEVTAGEQKSRDTVDVIVNPVDDPPRVRQPFKPFDVNEDALVQKISLLDIFEDIDSKMSFKVIDISNPLILKTDIVKDSLKILLFPDSNGVSSIVVEANSQGSNVRDTLTVTINAVDDPPRKTNEIADIIVDEDQVRQTIALSNFFTDVDNPDNQMLYSLFINSNPNLMFVQISKDTLAIVFLEDMNGNGQIVIRIQSSNHFIQDTIEVLVHALDDGPFVKTPIDPVVVEENDPPVTLNISGTFSDVDNPDNQISKRIFSQSNPALVKATIENNNLILEFAKNKFGEDSVTIEAKSNLKTVVTTVLVKVLDRTPPVITTSIQFLSVPGIDKNIAVYLYSDEVLKSPPQFKHIQNNTETVFTSKTFLQNKFIYNGTFVVPEYGAFQIISKSIDPYENSTVDTLEASINRLKPNVETQLNKYYSVVNHSSKSLMVQSTHVPVDNRFVNQLGVNLELVLPPEKVLIETNRSVQLRAKLKKDKRKNFYRYNSKHNDWEILKSQFKPDSTLSTEITFSGIVGVFYDPTLQMIPEQFQLYQNYPNPFNPVTLIQFDLIENENVTLIIYNSLGQQIRTLFKGALDAGEHKFYWNGENEHSKDVSSGIYFYQLKTTTKMMTKKMVLVR